nr:PIN domain-containing protein [Methylobacterium bullatum]
MTPAEREFFRLRWSIPILDETERAISDILAKRSVADSEERARRARLCMETAFDDAMVSDFTRFLGACEGLPDAGDAHVFAAALKTQAATIVTDNIKHCPASVLGPLNLEARTADAFIADTIALDEGKAVDAVRQLRLRLRRPGKNAGQLLLDMEAVGLTSTVDVLRSHEASL